MPRRSAGRGSRRSSVKSLLKRIGSAKEIGDAVCMLAGGAFAYMTGATVVIDGGLMLKQV